MRTIGIENPSPGEVGFWEMGPIPDPGPTQILIETLYSGVSNGLERSALLGEHAYAGRFPHRVGLQTAGHVIARGGDVALVCEGDPVFFGQDVGHRGWHLVDVGPNNFTGAEGHLVLPLTEDVHLEHCALLGAAALAVRAVLLFGVAPGDTVWVAGAGLVGQCCSQAARSAGAAVTVTEVDDVRLAMAASCGAHRILDTRDGADVEALVAGGPYDFILDASGERQLLHRIQDYSLLAHGGTLGLLALRDELDLQCALLRENEGSIRGVHQFDLEDLRVALQLLRQGALDLGALITHRFAIDEALEVYEHLRQPRHDLMGVIFDWRSGTSEQPAFSTAGALG